MPCASANWPSSLERKTFAQSIELSRFLYSQSRAPFGRLKAGYKQANLERHASRQSLVNRSLTGSPNTRCQRDGVSYGRGLDTLYNNWRTALDFPIAIDCECKGYATSFGILTTMRLLRNELQLKIAKA